MKPNSVSPAAADAFAQQVQDVLDTVEPSVDAHAVQSDVARPTEPRKANRTDEEKAVALIALVEGGMGCREASIKVGVNIRTAYDILARGDAQVESVRATIQKLMIAESLSRLDDWRTASDVGARKRGNHAPAKDWLMHAGVIDPLQSDAPSVQVAIVIGTEAHPMVVPSPRHLGDDQGDK